jgi:hypothetical protein
VLLSRITYNIPRISSPEYHPELNPHGLATIAHDSDTINSGGYSEGDGVKGVITTVGGRECANHTTLGKDILYSLFCIARPLESVMV